MADLLSMSAINALPHPLSVRLCGDKIEWPVESIDVETGLFQLDVCGKLQTGHFGDVAELIDGDGGRHDAEKFYSDYTHCEVTCPICTQPMRSDCIGGELTNAAECPGWALRKPRWNGAPPDPALTCWYWIKGAAGWQPLYWAALVGWKSDPTSLQPIAPERVAKYEFGGPLVTPDGGRTT